MTRRVATVLCVLGLGSACTVAVPYEPDGGGTEAGGVHPGSPSYETCDIDGTEGLADDEYLIQIESPDCATAICLHWLGETFCTRRCSADRDCLDIGRGRCEFDIRAGDPEFYGFYCVPSAIAAF
jgi:hypothetical protein